MKKKTAKQVGTAILKYVGRFLLCVLSFAMVICVTLLTAIYIISSGKSEVVRDLFVTTMTETGAMDFCARMFIPDDTVEEILEKGKMKPPAEKTDTNLIVIGENEDEEERREKEKENEEKGIVYNEEGVCLLDIKGKTFVGKMLIVKDPSRVHIVGLDAYGDGIVGKTTEQMVKDHNALAGINGGGYAEMSDYRTGGIPEGRETSGVVILNHKLLWGYRDSTYEIIGFDSRHILHLDWMTAQEALDNDIVEAINWGPILVKNGEPCVMQSVGENIGFHPRSAIGQRADGSVILLVIDGRQAHSMGASYDDLVEIMMEYDAVNAANLDGGMSSYMVYENEVITSPYMLYFNGRRTVATSIIVDRK